MKKNILFSIALLASVSAASACAQGKAGDACNFEGTLVGIGQPLVCVDHVLQPAVSISVRAKVLDEHQNLVTEFNVVGLNGSPTPISAGREITYVASAGKVKGKLVTTKGKVTEGYSAIFTPHLLPSGDILLNYEIMKSDLLAMPTVDLGDGVSIQTPSVDTLWSRNSIKLHSGRDVSVPFGMESGATRHSRYTIEFTASPIKS